MNILVRQAIGILAGLILGSDVFARILGTVERWAEMEISSAEKRNGVLNELEIIGLKLTESVARFGIELAVQYLNASSPIFCRIFDINLRFSRECFGMKLVATSIVVVDVVVFASFVTHDFCSGRIRIFFEIC